MKTLAVYPVKVDEKKTREMPVDTFRTDICNLRVIRYLGRCSAFVISPSKAPYKATAAYFADRLRSEHIVSMKLDQHFTGEIDDWSLMDHLLECDKWQGLLVLVGSEIMLGRIPPDHFSEHGIEFVLPMNRLEGDHHISQLRNVGWF